MNRLYALIILLSLCLGAFSQEITVRFTGQLNGTSYCRLDSVKVTNLTRNWTETVEYPDTIIVLGGTVGTNLNIAATQGLGQNIPNPFDCETRVELSVSQRENVRMQLLDASGKQYADYSSSLDAGVHTFDISAAAPQTYILNALVGDKSYSIRMVNMGSGCGSSIKYAGISGSITAKLTTANEFQNGDNMRYVGYTTIDGEVVESTTVEQAQTASEDITLNFAHCINTFGTDIQSACCSYTWIDGVTYTESTNEPTFTLTNAAGCDSVVTLHLTINHSNTGIDEQTACDSYEWIDGVTYTESTNVPTFTLTNAVGCDSVVTLHLTMVCPPTVQTDAATGITTTGVNLNGNVISDGGATVTTRGFLYDTSANNLSQIVQSGSGTGCFSANLTGLTSGTTYYYKAYATSSAGTAYGDIMSFTTETIFYSEPTDYVNGYGYVDLGLPSGTKWATCNVGASTPTAYGNYYAWGETSTKETYNSSTYTYSDNPTTLPLSVDAATTNWGSGWRMPTQTEMNELINNCTVTWTTQNGVNGRLFTGTNGNSIFLPASGYRNGSELDSAGSNGDYWSSSLGSYDTDGAWGLFIYSSGYMVYDGYRYYGFTVRAVCLSQN